MKTVTQNYIDAQKKPAPVMVRQLWYKRRYWQESTKTYIWESNWTQYTEDKIVTVSDITWQLDIQTLNEFKTSNVTLTLDNLTNQWRGDNPYGKFAKDATSPIYGYEPFWTKFQIRAGINYVAVGATTQTTEVVNIFTGVATEYTVDSVSGAMQITLTGEEAILIGGNAESVSTTVTGETLTGTVDGSNKIFTTAHNGVGIFSEVSDNGLTKRAGTDYTLSQLNDPSNPGKVTFVVAPTSGHTVRGSYLYWKSSQKFEDLVTALLNQAGIPGGNQFVSPVVFPSNIINTHIWQTQADWVGGSSLTNIDTASIPNSIEYLYSNAQTWNNSTSGWTLLTYNSTGSAATWNNDSTGNYFLENGGNGAACVYRSMTQLYGDWSISFQVPDPTTSGFMIFRLALMAGAVATPAHPATQSPFQNALIVDFRNFHNTANSFNSTYLTDSSGNFINGSAFRNNFPVSYNTTHTVRVRHRPNTNLTYDVYFDGSLMYTFDQTQTGGTIPTSSTYFGYEYTQGMNSGSKLYFLTNGVSTPTSTTGLGTWISSAVDFGATPSAWTQLLFNQTLNSGVVTYYTATSADNITYDSYVALPVNGVPASTLRRYVKVKIIIDITLGDPVVASASIGAITSSTTITLANFTAMTCYDAITALANFANYEFGFDSSENFFFRPKNPGNNTVFTMTEADFNMKVVAKVTGFDRVYSKIRATYAGYLKDVSDDGLTYLGPLPRVGYNLLQVDGGSILLSADADVATGIAGSFFNYYRLPRRRVKIQSQIIPQLDISDVVLCSFQDLYPTRWVIGDSSTYIGDQAKSLYGPDEQILQPLPMKVVGMRMDTNSWQTEFDLEEVI